jgi:hypothetical protein
MNIFPLNNMLTCSSTKRLKFSTLMEVENLSTPSLHLISIHQVLSIKFHVHIHVKKILVSRRVVFDETMFPYKPSTTIQPSSHTFKIFDTWIPHISQSVLGNIENKETTPSCSPLPGITQEQNTPAIQLSQDSRLQPAGSPAPPQGQQ